MRPNLDLQKEDTCQIASSVPASLIAKMSGGGRFVRNWLNRLWKYWLAFEEKFPRIGNIRHFCWGIMAKYHHDDCFSYAAGLSFWFLISMVPLATLFFKILMIFLGNHTFFQQAQDILINVIPFIPEDFLINAVSQTRDAGNSLGFAWIVLLFGSYWGMNQLDKSLTHVFGVRIHKQLQTRKYHIFRQMGLLISGLVLLALVLALLVGGGVVRGLSPANTNLLMGNLSVLISLVATTLIFLYVPRLSVAFRHAFLGALVSTCFWTIAKWAFKIYVAHALTWNITYGSLLGIIAGLTFLYYTCAILMLGAEVTAAFYVKDDEKKSIAKVFSFQFFGKDIGQ
ncbi:MAG: YihY/virulence factor BrkB family protein [Holophagaceae bacterium]|nr:YihY/virulence factor BrkB family protein [Holophagaceae bacterium]